MPASLYISLLLLHLRSASMMSSASIAICRSSLPDRGIFSVKKFDSSLFAETMPTSVLCAV